MAIFSTNLIAPPSRIQINGMDEAADLATKSTGTVDIGFDITTPLRQVSPGKIRVLFRVSSDDFNSYYEVSTAWYNKTNFLPPDERFHFTLSGLAQNSHYRVRAWSENNGAFSAKFNSFDFWTNRYPNLPELVTPAENSTFDLTTPVVYDWRFSDPDPDDDQTAFEVRWRNVVDQQAPGPWVTIGGGKESTVSVAGPNYQANRYYEWQVRVRDEQGGWSDWSLTRSFYMQGLKSPPLLIAPVNDVGVDVLNPVIFRWQFRDPDTGDYQDKADLRYRVVGTNDWTTIAGVSMDNTWSYQLPVAIMLPDFHYEWQVQTYDHGSGGTLPSGWSNSGTFYSIRTPGELSVSEFPSVTNIQGALGCGHNRVFIYQQGGTVKVGEVTSVEQVVWSRRRDDISNCVVDTADWDRDCGDLLSRLRSWQHEVVIFRDGVRVWEGPITRITYTSTNVQIEAKDVMGYVYRRIMRQGYNDSYHCSQQDADGNCVGVQLGLNTVVYRATRIITDAMARGDHNVLPYLTAIDNSNDARQSRIVPDFSRTAWEEVDNLAATAGLDYVTVGRRIMLWDTHYPIGKLPEMRDGDFSDPVIVTEYGMNLCNFYGVTDGNGNFGTATPFNEAPYGNGSFYGLVELLSSSYGDSSEDGAIDASTPAAVAELRQRYSQQAQRNIGHRWPTPVVVRVPDNTTINPDVNLSINHLIPGVWIPLRSTATLREIAQWQKLDLVTVTESGGSGSETIQVTMSPAPNGGDDDPDADNAATQDA